jgi:hypothetical protein
MIDLDEREEGIDAILRATGPRLRAAMSQRPVVEFRRPRRSHRRTWIIAIATVVVLVVGLVAIGTNRNDQSQGNPSSRLYWQLTDLPDDFALVQMSEPGSQNGPAGSTVMVNVYATEAAPLGPILSIRGSMGAGLEIVPVGGTNFQETTIGGNRAAFADGGGGTRLLYIETDGHWVEMTSKNIDDATLSTMAQSMVRDPEGTAMVPASALLDGLTLVLPSDAPAAFLGMGTDFSGISYGTPDGGSISLQVYPSKPSPRALLGLQTSLTPIKVAGANGFSGGYSAGESDTDYRVVTWERDGLDFRVGGFNVTDAEVMSAAESAEPVSESKWNEMLRQTGGGLAPEGAPAGTVPAEEAPAGTDPPFTGEVRDVSVEVVVTNPSANEQVWSGTLPTGEAWKVDVTRVFDSIAIKAEIDGVGQGMLLGPLVRTAGQELGCCPLSVVTADPNAASMRVTTHHGDRFSIPLHELPGTDGLRIAVITLPNGSGPQGAELIDADGNVLETLPGGS